MNFRGDAAFVLEHDQMDYEAFESFKGRLEWVNRFLVAGQRRCATAYACMRRSRRRPGKVVLLSDDLKSNVEETLRMLDDPLKTSFRPMVRDPRFMHGGDMVAADASTKDGWGAHIGGLVAGSLWQNETLLAIERSRSKKKVGARVSISPLEMLAQAFLLILVGVFCKEETKLIKQVVHRCDNESCVAIIASRRPKSPAMEVTLTIVEEVELAFGLLLALEHIGTKDNVIAM